MQKIALVLLAAALSVPSAGAQDYLEPKAVPYAIDHYISMSPNLARGYTDDVVLRFAASPAFSGPYITGMRDAGRSGGSGRSVFFLRAIFGWDDGQLPLADCEKPIDAATAQLLSAAWIGTLREARPPRSSFLFVDATTFHFFSRTTAGDLAGRTKVPAPDSNPRRLVELAMALARHCDGKLDVADIGKKAAALCDKLGKDACRN
ncbi:MAG: hypothetical protein FWD68_14045 [Alphaproteobacteria bacterium]|nr:hypothetical protein [Alphaproteobacteria bacterium]